MHVYPSLILFIAIVEVLLNFESIPDDSKDCVYKGKRAACRDVIPKHLKDTKTKLRYSQKDILRCFKLQIIKKRFKRQLKKKCRRMQKLQRLKDTDAKTKIRCGEKSLNKQFRELKKKCEIVNKNLKIKCEIGSVQGKCKARNGTCKISKTKQGGNICYCEIKSSRIMV